MLHKTIFYLLILFLPFHLIAKERAKNQIILQLSWLHQFQFAGYYMAKEKGFYKKAGIDIEINEFQYGLDISKVLETNQADFAIGRSSLLIDKFNGKDVVALAAIFQKSPLMLLVTRKSGINSINDLKNKNVMITSDAKASASIISMLQSEGVMSFDINIQKHSFNLDDLISGKTDAMASYVSNEPIRLAEKNIDYKIFHPEHYGFKFYDDILYSSSKYINKNPEITKKFLDATLKGWEYAFEHIGETSEVIFQKYNSQNKTKIQLVKEGEVLKTLAYAKENTQIGSLDKKVLEKIVDTYKVLGLIRDDIDLNSFVYEHNPHNIHHFQFSNKEIMFFGVIGILAVIILLLMSYYASIKSKWLIHNTQLTDEIENAKKEIEKQKNQIENQYKKVDSIINASNDIIVFKDENLNYLECNTHFAGLFGKTKDEIIGKSDYFLFDNDIADIIREEDSGIIKSNQPTITENWIQFPNNKEAQLYRAFLQPYEYEKDKIGLIVFSQNITNQYNLEQTSKKNQKLLTQHSKIVSITKLINNIAHQWRQPLSIIAMSLSNVQLNCSTNENPSKELVLQEVERSIKQLDNLSQVINSFGKYFDSKTIEINETTAKQIFQKLDNFLTNNIDEKHINVVTDIEDVELTINVNLLIQSIINIYNNSIDAFEVNEINNEDRFIFVSAKQVGNNLVIKIKDSGDGIKKEIIDRVFEPYATTKHQYVGVGLSLYITYHIIVDHFHGKISAENITYEYNNKEFKGAEFTISLPIE